MHSLLGKSVYISSNKETQDKTISTLNKGDYCFISLHTPEDFVDGFKDQALDLIDRINDRGAKIIADIAPVGIENLGFKSFKDLACKNLVWGLRPDYGLNTQEILEAAEFTNIVLNASIIDKELVKALYDNNVQIYAMHNFYPRPETGLDFDFCNERTDYLHQFGAQVFAFISSDKDCRGPIFEGLPTLEYHRGMTPYVQYLELKHLSKIDCVFVGDVALSQLSENLILQTEDDKIIRIPAILNNEYQALYDKTFTIRHDSNSLVARLQESRTYANSGQIIKPQNNDEPRKTGTITIDNQDYLRYSGEIQIVLSDLVADKRVNTIGRIEDKYLDVIEVLRSDKKIKFVKIN